MLAALVAATPQPFLQPIVDVAPTRTVFGRVCLLGDAAFVVRPHTAGATAKAARDATTLARALKRAGRNVDAGLSSFGKTLVGAMNKHRVAVDVAHAGVRTSLDAIARSAAPVIASHANARAVCDHPRNLPDEVIKAIAASGGVIGLCAFSSFVTAEPAPSLARLLDHAAYIADLVGAAHVGLGLDFADETEEEYDFYGYDERYYPRPPWTWPSGIQGLHECGSIAPALQARGFSPGEVAGIRGANFLRVLTTIWGS